MRLLVTLNGSAENPWHRYGLRANPFPQIPKAEAATANRILRDLDADPIKDKADLRKRLQGCTPEFITGCVNRFKPGKRVSFVIDFPAPEWE